MPRQYYSALERIVGGVMIWENGTRVRVGQAVRCERTQRARGTWAKYNGKRGTITQVSEEIDGVKIHEVCVAGNWDGEAWFRLDELVRL